MNVVTLIGNLATDVDLRVLDGDKRVANFLLAIGRPGGEEADFVRITVWDKQAETCARYLTKGKKVAVDGRLRSSSWEEDGKRRTSIEVVGRHVEFLSPPDNGAAPAELPFEGAAA